MSASAPAVSLPSSEFFGVDKEKRHQRAAETIEAVLKIWETDGPLTTRGSSPGEVAGAAAAGDLGLWLKPFTKPHPPIAVAGVSPTLPLSSGRGRMVGFP